MRNAKLWWQAGRIGVVLAWALVAGMGAERARAGELLDYLPEVQFARAMVQIVETQDVFLDGAEGVCTGEESLDQVPYKLWVDAAGNLRSPEAVAGVLQTAQCALSNVSPQDVEPDAFGPSVLAPFLSLLRGEVVTVGDATIDGGKEPLRVGLSFSVAFLISVLQAFGVPLDSPELLGEDACAALRGFATEGETFELRWVGFLNLLVQFDPDANADEDAPACVDSTPDAEANLLARARGGDVDAAVQLAYLWDQQVGDFQEGPLGSDEAAVQAEIDALLLVVLEHTGAAPLVSLAATIPYISLNVGTTAS